MPIGYNGDHVETQGNQAAQCFRHQGVIIGQNRAGQFHDPSLNVERQPANKTKREVLNCSTVTNNRLCDNQYCFARGYCRASQYHNKLTTIRTYHACAIQGVRPDSNCCVRPLAIRFFRALDIEYGTAISMGPNNNAAPG